MAIFPNEVKTFNYRVNLQSVVLAEDVNQIYDEVTAIETHLGGGGVTTSATWGAGNFNSAKTSWSSLKERLQNIENGTYRAYQDRLQTGGGSAIVITSPTVIGLSITAHATQTANLFEWKNSAGTRVASIGPAGAFVALSINGGTA